MACYPHFLFLLGRAFIEAVTAHTAPKPQHSFPFLSGGAFIEARRSAIISLSATANFPFFLEGLSLRLDRVAVIVRQRRDFPSFLEELSRKQTVVMVQDDCWTVCSAA